MYKIGVDLGGTNIAVGVVDENQPLYAPSLATAPSPRFQEFTINHKSPHSDSQWCTSGSTDKTVLSL